MIFAIIVVLGSKIDLPLYKLRQSLVAQDALDLYANNPFFYRLEYLLSKLFSNSRTTFAV